MQLRISNVTQDWLGALASPVDLLAQAAILQRLAGSTVWLVGWVVVLSLLLGVPLAMVISRTRFTGRQLALAMLFALLFAPLYLQASAWQAVWGVQGWLVNLLGFLPVEGWTAVIWIHTAAAIPWVVLMVTLGLEQVEPELEEDALLDASPLTVFWRVTLMRALPSVFAAALLVAAQTAGEMTVTNLYQKQTLSEMAYLQYAGTAETEMATGNLLWGTLGMTLLIAAALLAIRSRVKLERHTSQRRLRVLFRGSASALAGFAAWTLLVALVGVPLIGLIAKAGIVVTRSAEGFQRSWSLLKAIATVLQSPLQFHRELTWSLIIGASAATAATLFALLMIAAARLYRVNRAARGVSAALIVFCLVVPGPLVGIGLIGIFHSADWGPLNTLYDRSIAAPVIAQGIKAFPLAALILWQAISAVPRELIESAAVDGAGRVAILWRIIVPLVWRSIVTAWLVSLAVAMGDLAASILVMPPGVETLAIHIFGLIHFGVDDRVAGITLAMSVLFVVIGLLSSRFARHGMLE